MRKLLYNITPYLLALSIFGFLIICLTGCLNLAGDCETKLSRHIFNPGNNIQAVTMITDCGATTSPSYGVRIVESVDTTDFGDPDNTILGSNSGVDIKWISNDTLIIKGADTTSGYTMKNRLKLKKSSIEIVILYDK